MIQNIVHKGVDSFLIAKNGFHLPQFFFAPFDNLWISIFCHNVIFLVNELQSLLIQFQLDNTAFVIYRTSSTIFNCLCHVVNIYVVTKHFTSIAVFHRNRCSGKSDKSCIRQSIADNTSRTDFDFTCLDIDLFFQTVLPTMSFIRHNHNISALRKAIKGFLKFLHRGKNNAVCFSTVQ